MLYGKTGRPNFSVARVLGLCLLQEFNTLTDQKALDAFSFDIRWRYALDVNEGDDYLSRRSLVEFRRRLAAKDPGMTLVRNVFDNVRDTAIKKLGLSARDQRLDSTHIISNIRTRGRLALFTDTLTVFLKSLSEDRFSRVPKDFRLEITPEIRLRDQMYTRQQTTEWKDRYKIRSGIEATNSELKRCHGVGKLRVRRAVKVCFAVACKVIACNIRRWAARPSFPARSFTPPSVVLLGACEDISCRSE